MCLPTEFGCNFRRQLKEKGWVTSWCGELLGGELELSIGRQEKERTVTFSAFSRCEDVYIFVALDHICSLDSSPYRKE